MPRIEVHIRLNEDETLDAQQMMKMLIEPAQNYGYLKKMLSLFTGEKIYMIEHVMRCTDISSEETMQMLLVWVLLKDNSNRLYSVVIDDWAE
ncbi:MAG: hypothetical protein IKY14_07770 [Erysipelotrichaceae bacterium]|jgi:hypothetical protein|nr:hypothetical protein [Erysipelotrichaceae bacterium]